MLTGISLSRFRGILEAHVEGFARVNLFVGKNGSGKSTLLESIYTVGTQAGSPAGPLMQLRDGSRDYNSRSEPLHWQDSFWFGRDKTSPLKIDLVFGAAQTVRLIAPLGERAATLASIIKGQPTPFSAKVVGADIVKYLSAMRIADARSLLNRNTEQQLWDLALNERLDRTLVKAINDIYSLNLEGFSYSSQASVLKALFNDRPYALDVDDLGAGMRIAIRLFLNLIPAKGGALLVEEFDAYQHVGALEKLAASLFRIATDLNVQVFLTTHSEETVRSFVSNDGIPERDQIRVFQTSLSPTGEFKAALLKAPQAATLLEAGVDVRRT